MSMERCLWTLTKVSNYHIFSISPIEHLALDDTPRAYFSNAARPTAPSSVHRAGTSSRAVNHSSDVDFDRVPSPHTTPSAFRRPDKSRMQVNRSKSHEVHSTSGATRMSRISTSYANVPPADDMDMSMDQSYRQAEESSSPDRRNSFSQMNGDDDMMNEEPLPSSPTSAHQSSRSTYQRSGPAEQDGDDSESDGGDISGLRNDRKGKGKQRGSVADEESVEDFAQAMDDIGEVDEDSEEEVEQPPPKKMKATTTSRKKKENKQLPGMLSSR